MRHPLDYYIRSSVTGFLSIFIVVVAAYQVVASGVAEGPFVNWAGIIVGVYFGAHITIKAAAANGHRIDTDLESEQLDRERGQKMRREERAGQ